MSRSKHQTVKGVFGGRSADEIEAMVVGGDDDVAELSAKKRLKREEHERRAQQTDRRTNT